MNVILRKQFFNSRLNIAITDIENSVLGKTFGIRKDTKGEEIKKDTFKLGISKKDYNIEEKLAGFKYYLWKGEHDPISILKYAIRELAKKYGGISEVDLLKITLDIARKIKNILSTQLYRELRISLLISGLIRIHLMGEYGEMIIRIILTKLKVKLFPKATNQRKIKEFLKETIDSFSEEYFHKDSQDCKNLKERLNEVLAHIDFGKVNVQEELNALLQVNINKKIKKLGLENTTNFTTFQSQGKFEALNDFLQSPKNQRETERNKEDDASSGGNELKAPEFVKKIML